jgi:hypothetical protein
MSVKLTGAQQTHLQALLDAARNANRNVDLFVEYLRDEHEAPEDKFQLADLREGFVEIEEPQE